MSDERPVLRRTLDLPVRKQLPEHVAFMVDKAGVSVSCLSAPKIQAGVHRAGRLTVMSKAIGHLAQALLQSDIGVRIQLEEHSLSTVNHCEDVSTRMMLYVSTVGVSAYHPRQHI